MFKVASGELRYRQVSSSPVRDARNNIIGSVSVVHDITDLKRAREELRRKAEELRATNEELTRLNRAMVARELRMIELKRQVNEMCEKAGLPQKYKIKFANDQ